MGKILSILDSHSIKIFLSINPKKSSTRVALHMSHMLNPLVKLFCNLESDSMDDERWVSRNNFFAVSKKNRCNWQFS